MTKKRIRILKGLECCERQDCENCPYLSEECDEPFIEYVMLPRHLLTEIRAEMYEDAPLLKDWQTTEVKVQ